MRYLVWTVLVWLPAIVLASVALASVGCANPDGCIGLDGGDIAVIVLFVFALPLYLIGLVLMWVAHLVVSAWRRRSVSVNTPPGPPARRPRRQGW